VWRAARSSRWGSALFVRATQLVPIEIPQFGGWVVGGEVTHPRSAERPLRIFSIHGPAGERGYVRTMHEILDRIVRIPGAADLVLGGDFNVAVGYRADSDPRRLSRGERELLDRIGGELDLMPTLLSSRPLPWSSRQPNGRCVGPLTDLSASSTFSPFPCGLS
jgi:hypothetical protein